MSIYLLGIIIPVFSFILQIWPRLINRYFGIDTWRHLMFAEYVRKYRKLPQEISDRYLVKGPFNYPPVIILLLSLFPKAIADKYQFIFSPFFDFINNYFIFLATYVITGEVLAGIFAQIVAALVPIVVIEASNLSSRIFSNFLYSISFFSLIYFTYTHNSFWLGIAAIFLFILFFSHKFALQAYLFTMIGFTLFERNLFYVLFFLGMFLMVYLFGGTLYRTIFRDHMLILDYWRKNINLRFAHQFRGIPKKNDGLDFVGKVYLLSVKNPYMYIIGNNPWVAILLLILSFEYSRILTIISPIPQIMYTKLFIWIISGLLSTIIVSVIKPLRFLGEGQRYMEYCVLPMAIILGTDSLSLYRTYGLSFILIFGIVAFGILISIIFIQKKTILEDKSRTITDGLWTIIHYLNKNGGKNIRLAVFPFQMGDALMYFLQGRVLTTDSVVGIMKLNDVFPVLTKPLSEIVMKYKINYVLFQKNYVSLEELTLKKYKIIKNIGGFMLLRVRN